MYIYIYKYDTYVCLYVRTYACMYVYPLITRTALPSTTVPCVKNPLRHMSLRAKEHICN